MTNYNTVEIGSLEDLEIFMVHCQKVVTCCEDRVVAVESTIERLLIDLEHREFSNVGDDTLNKFIRAEKGIYILQKERHKAEATKIDQETKEKLATILESGPMQ